MRIDVEQVRGTGAQETTTAVSIDVPEGNAVEVTSANDGVVCIRMMPLAKARPALVTPITERVA